MAGFSLFDEGEFRRNLDVANAREDDGLDPLEQLALSTYSRNEEPLLIDPDEWSARTAPQPAGELIPSEPRADAAAQAAPQNDSSFFGSIFDIDLADFGKLLLSGASQMVPRSLIAMAGGTAMAQAGASPEVMQRDPQAAERMRAATSPAAILNTYDEIGAVDDELMRSRSAGARSLDAPYAKDPGPGETGTSLTEPSTALGPLNPLGAAAMALEKLLPDTPFIGRKAVWGGAKAGTILQDVVRSGPGMVAGMIEGAGIGKILRAGAGKLFGREAIEAAAKAGDAAAVERLARLTRIDKVLTGAGYGAGEAAVAAPQAAADVRDEVMDLPPALLMQLPRFQEIYSAAEELPEAERIAYAQSTLASELGNSAALKVALATLATGPLAADVALRAGTLIEGRTAVEALQAVSRGRLKQAGVDAAQETGQEFAQSGAQDYLTAREVQQVDPRVDPQMRAVNAAIGGAAAGGVLGGTVGALTGGGAEAREGRPAPAREPPDAGESPPSEASAGSTAPSAPVTAADISRLAGEAKAAGVDGDALRQVSQAVIRKQLKPAEAVEALQELIRQAKPVEAPIETAPEAAGAAQAEAAPEAGAAPAEGQAHAQSKPDTAQRPARTPEVEAYRAKAKEETGNERYFSADLAKELYPEYAASNEARMENTVAVHAKSTKLRDEAFADALAEPADPGEFVTFTSGSTGSGKSSGSPQSGIVYDSTLASFEAATKQIDAALNSGRDVLVNHTNTDIETGFRRTLSRQRKIGRPVSIKAHLNSHRGANETARRLAEKYADDPRVRIRYYDNSGEAPAEIAAAPQIDYNGADERLRRILDEEHQAGNVSDRLYEIIAGNRARSDDREAGVQVSAGSERDGAPGGNESGSPRAKGVLTEGRAAPAAVPDEPDPFAPENATPAEGNTYTLPHPNKRWKGSPLAEVVTRRDPATGRWHYSVQGQTPTDGIGSPMSKTDFASEADAINAAREALDKAFSRPSQENTASGKAAKKILDWAHGGMGRQAPRPAKRNTTTPDPKRDSILEYLAKTKRGISREEAEQQGIDPAAFSDRGLMVGIKRAFRKGGMSFDEVAEMLHEVDYPVADEQGRYSVNVLLDRIDDEIRGKKHYSLRNETRQAEVVARAEEARRLRAEFEAPEIASEPESGKDFAELLLEAKKHANEDEIESALEAQDDVEAERRLRALIARGEYRGTSVETQADEPGGMGQDAREREEDRAGRGGKPGEEGDFQLTGEASTAQRLADLERARQPTREQRDKADAEAQDFRLSGSDRPADVGAAGGQTDVDDAIRAAPAVSKNTIFTEEAYAAARARLMAKLNRPNAGIDPELMLDGLTTAGYHIEKGARTFVAFSKAMVEDMGDIVRPYLKSWYMALRYDPRAANFANEMSSADEVDKADAATVDKAGTAAGATLTMAEQRFVREIMVRLPPGNLSPLLRSIIDARALYGRVVGGDMSGAAIKRVDELVELAVVQAARQIANGAIRNPVHIFEALTQQYAGQPTLSTRTSTSIENQAYSTPAPLAYLASRLAGITKDTLVYEPSAGNGMLLLEANPAKTHAVELNEDRAAALRAQGFKPVVGDTLWPSSAPDRKQDVVIANPPFGVVKTDQGDSQTFTVEVGNETLRTNEIDHAIALTALKSMKDDGRAVLIIGGVNKLAKTEEARSDAYNGAAKRKFFYYLQRQYNVVDHFTVAGELYAKQGAGWPVDVIVIDGRRPSVRALPAVDVPRVYNSWADLKPLLEAANERTSSLGTDTTTAVDAADGGVVPTRASAGSVGVPEPARGAGAADDRRGAGPETGDTASTEGAARGGPAVGPGARPAGRGGQSAGLEQSGGRGETRQLGAAAQPAAADGRGDAGGAAGDGPRPAEPAGPARPVGERPASGDVASGGQTAYQPSSSAGAIGTLVPSNMQTAIADALSGLSARVGSLDAYVARELGYEPSALGTYFSAEQVDAIALALDQMERGAGFIIGDQTGVGKGRFVAAMIRHALKNGRVPIFVTEKPNLYADIVRDLRDIAQKDIRPLMTNAGERVPIDDAGAELRTQGSGPHNALLARISESADLGDFNMVFTTYNQMQTVKGEPTARMNLLQALAPNAVVIFDESHNAGGNDAARRNAKQKEADGGSAKTGRAAFARGLASMARGVIYSSATYAKRPSVMDLYFKTDMSMAVEGNAEKLPAAIALGGVPLQQAVASMLARAGQYIRRERSFAGVEYNTPVVPVDRGAAESISAMMLAVKQFDDAKKGAVEALKKSAKAEAKLISGSTATGAAGAQSTNFTSVMHNLIDQMLLALKADRAADIAIEALKRGEKPVITVSNTMGSFIEQYVDAAGLTGGDSITLTFRDLMLRYLEKSRDVLVKAPDGRSSRHHLTDEELGPVGRSAFKAARAIIDGSPQIQAVPISPIDWIHHRLREAGYKSGEITGRGHTIEYASNGRAVYRPRSGKETSILGRRNAINTFNNGKLDAIVLNQAGATGLSLHASEKFKDQRRRRMVIAQAEKNIDTHMQMLGRVHRTGQVIAPAYDQLVADIPAEKRPAAVLAKKMASLNANTTASRSSQFTSKETVDFLNEYGDEVVAQLMADLPEIHIKLGEPLERGEDGFEKPDAARKVTGRIPMLPVDEQEGLYELIEAAYTDRLQQAEALGENALEAKTLPLEARTLDSRVIFGGAQGGSPFAAGATAEVVDVKRLGKPYTSEKVREIVATTLGRPTDSTLDQLAKAGREAREQLLRDVKDRYQTYRAAEESRMLASEMTEAAREGRLGALDGTRARWNAIAGLVHIGGSYELTMADGTTMYGVVTEIRHKTGVKMPVALGSWSVHFAVADGARALTMPFSRLAPPGESVAGIQHVSVDSASRNPLTGASIEQMFDDGQTQSRERRVIVTGNLLAGYAQMRKGQVVHYTDNAGRTLQGILMPRSFDLEEFTADAPVTLTPHQAVALLKAEASAIVRSADGALQVKRAGENFWIVAPRSKAEGGKYFLDRGLREIVGDFVSTSSSMRAIVPADQVVAALDYIGRNMGQRFETTTHREEAVRVGGTAIGSQKAAATPPPSDDALYSRAGAAPTFYSAAIRATEALPFKKASGPQWYATISKRPGVKPEELEWMGLKEWLGERQGVTKDDLLAFMRANQIIVEETVLGGETTKPLSQRDIESVNTALEDKGASPLDEEQIELLLQGGDEAGDFLSDLEMRVGIDLSDIEYVIGDAKFGSHALPGGENYRELLLKLPPPTWWHPGRRDAPSARAAAETFRGLHFEEPNVLAHVRFNERKDSDGKRVLFIEEIQSDWHQAGRKLGYVGQKKATPTLDEVANEIYGRPYNELDGVDQGAVQDEHDARVNGTGGAAPTSYGANAVPDAPFRTTWPELALKRMIRYAVENGFDRIAWTTGEQQADRYDLSKHVDELRIKRWPDGDFAVQGRKGGVEAFSRATITAAALPEYVGKEFAERILSSDAVRNAPPGKEVVVKYSGVDLKVGGAGMRTFYDKMLVSAANKYVKKWGARVAPVRLFSATEDFDLDDIGNATPDELDEGGASFQAHAIDVTDAMREAVLAGQPLFSANVAPVGASVAQVRAWLAKGIAKTRGAAETVVVADVAELRRVTGRQNIPDDVEGVYYTGGRTVYLVANRLPDAETAQRKWAHEMMGHLAPERYEDMRRAVNMALNLRKMKSRSVGALWDEVASKQPGLSETRHAKEVIALMAERGVKNSIIDRLIAWVRQTLRDWGVEIDYSEAELRALIARAARALETDARLSARDEANAAAAESAKDDAALGAALGAMDMAGTPLLDSGAPLDRFYRRPAQALDTDGLDDASAEAIDDAIAAHWVPSAQFSREDDGAAFAADVLAELGAVDELFKNPTTPATSLEDAVKDLAPDIRWGGEDSLVDEREDSRADRRFVVFTQNNQPIYLYERGREVWIDVSRLQRGEGGDRVYQAVADYARNTGRRFIGDPEGLSAAAMARRTYHMLSNMIRYGDVRGFEPAKEQLRGSEEGGIAPLAWPADNVGRFRALIDTFYRTTAKHAPEIENLSYDFNRKAFVDQRTGAVVGRDVFAGIDFARGSRATPLGIRTLRAAVFLQSLARREGGQRSALLAQVLRQPSELVTQGGLDPLFSLAPSEDSAVAAARRRIMAAAGYAALPLRDRLRLFMRKHFDFSKLAARQYIVNSFASIAAYERMMNAGRLLDASVSAYKQTVATQNLGSVMSAVLEHGIPEWRNGAYVIANDGRKGITEIFAPLVNHPDGNLLPKWEYYAAARRASRLIEEGRENLFTQDDIDNALAEAARWPEFAQVFDDWQAFNKQALDMAEAAGLIDPESRAIWERNDYVPFYRVVEAVSGRLNQVSLKKAVANQRARIRTLKGGMQPLEDVFESMLMNTAHLVDASFKNRAAQAIVTQFDGVATTRIAKAVQPVTLTTEAVRKAVEASGLTIEGATDEEYMTFFRRVAPTGKNIVSVMFAGKPQYFQVHDPLLYESMVQMNPSEFLRRIDIFGLVSGAKHLLTRAVTAMPGFIVSNFMRDTLSNVVQNENKKIGDMLKLTFLSEAGKGFTDYVRDNRIVHDLMMAGAGGDQVYDHERGSLKKILTRQMQDAEAKRFLDTVVSPRRAWGVYRKLQQASENANRIAVYRLVRKRGGSHAEAAYQAHDVLNFQQRGSHPAMQLLTLAVPFLNARVQGLDRLARGYAANRAGFLLKGLVLTAATLAIMAAGDDDDRYQELEEWDRDMYWHMWFGDTHIRLPKPFEVGMVFGTIPERAIRLMRGQDRFRTTANALGRMVFDTFAFNPTPQIVKPVVEAWAGKSFFTGAPILSSQDKNVLPEARYRPWTSPTLIELAKAMPDGAPEFMRSPIQLEYLLRGYLGGMAMFGLETADTVTRAAGGYPDAPAQAFHEYALRRFVREGEPRRTKWHDELYRMMDIADDTARTIKKLGTEGQYEDARELATRRRAELLARPRLSAIAKEMRRLNAQARMIEASRLDGDRKRAALEKVYAQRNDVARLVEPYAPLF